MKKLKQKLIHLKKYEIAKKNKSSIGQEEKRKNQLSIVLKCQTITPIIDTFIKGFSVIFNEAAKELILLLYKCFNFISEKIDHLIISLRNSHLERAILIINKINKTFKKMIKYTKPINKNKQDSNQDEKI